MVEDMSKFVDTLIIGGGIYGCLCSLELSKLGRKVLLLEKNENLISGSSSNNTNRLHLGYHYPRDLNTAEQCKKGFQNFIGEFPDCLLKDINNFYFISSHGSKVNPKQYREFCKLADLPFDEYTLKDLPEKVNNIDLAISTNEVIYDCEELTKSIIKKFIKNKINYQNNLEVQRIEEFDQGFKIFTSEKELFAKSIINCTYSNYNKFHSALGLKKKIYKYELTIVPIIRWRNEKPLIGVTIMDGNFFSVLPHGKSKNYTLYHVEHSVFKSEISDNLPDKWNNPKDLINKDQAFLIYKKMVNSIKDWLPSIKHSEFLGYLSAVRIVLANVEDTDARPSLLERMSTKNCFYSLFSGKIDHSIWVSKEVASLIDQELN